MSQSPSPLDRLRATFRWKADDLERTTRAVACRLKAAHHFQRASEKQEFEAEDVPRYHYLIGEVYRRAGHFGQALIWFDQVATEDTRLSELLRRQRQMAVQKEVKKAMLEK